MLETCFKKPILQNLDAIPRNSVLVSQTHLLWRALLLALILLPMGLGLAYKVFVGGHTTRGIVPAAMFYGLTAPSGLQQPNILKFGPAYMVNATLPFLLASQPPSDTAPPPPPLDFSDRATTYPYGFNVLVLSKHSTAFLDVPMPLNVSSLQASLNNDTGNYLTLTAAVHATVATYDDFIEGSGSQLSGTITAFR